MWKCCPTLLGIRTLVSVIHRLLRKQQQLKHWGFSPTERKHRKEEAEEENEQSVGALKRGKSTRSSPPGLLLAVLPPAPATQLTCPAVLTAPSGLRLRTPAPSHHLNPLPGAHL